MNLDDYECEGQLSIFDLDLQYLDKTYSRNEKEYEVPKWMHYERCENCTRWAKYPVNEQPPCGWGIYGFCQEHKQKTDKCGYCQVWEDKRKI